jgi:GAF domain-containing protein
LPKLLPYDALWIALTDKATGVLHVTHAEPTSLIETLRRGGVPLETSFHGQSLREMKAAHGVIGPQDEGDPSASGVFTLLGFRSFLVAPLPSVERAFGTLAVVSRQEGVYGDEEVRILASVASAVAVGIEQAELFRRTREFAEELESRCRSGRASWRGRTRN